MARTTTILHDQRTQLLSGIPLVERHITAAGVPTAVLEGGAGQPLLLLHGPGESAVNWRWVAPDLVTTHRVVAPDLPGHGSTGTDPARLDEDGVLTWLADVIDQTCPEPPTLVGHVLGGAIAARFAIHHSDRVRGLVLVDSLGLGRFRPSPRFAARFVGFISRPNEKTYEKFMEQCAYDLDGLRHDMADEWAAFAGYNLGLARSANAKAGGKLFRKVGVPHIPADQLDRISVPAALVWGREDRANKLKVAEKAAARHNWPLYIIDAAADDPPRDQPAAFVRALRAAVGSSAVPTPDQ